MARTLFDIYRNTETANATATATQSKPRTLFDIYGKQGAENVQNYQSSQVVDTDYNKGGLLGGIGYTLGKFGTGAFSILEGIWDYTAGGIADLFGADEWAEEQFANNVTANWNQDLDEWYNPSKVMRGVGDVASGVGNTLAGVGIGTIVSVASGGTLAPAVIGGIAMGVGSAGMATSEAYAKTGKLGLKEYGYGALVGATEGALETVSGVTGKYAGKLASKMLAKNTAKTVAKNTLIKSIAKDIFNDFKGEFIEEAVSEFITPVYQRWTQVDPNAEYATIQQIGYAGLIGGISGAIMGGVSNGVSAVGMARRGNEIAKSPEHVNSVVNMASRFADYEAENNTGDEAYQYLSQALNDYKARDNGTGILTPVQKQDLAKMERASVILMYSDNVKASKQKIVDNADAFADYINSRNMVDENGNAIRYANGAELLKDDRTVTQFAVADMLGDMLMPTENMYGTVLQQNTNALREEDFANFQKKATPQQKKSVNELLGVDVDQITYADFAKSIQNADKTKLADVETGIRARASSKRVLTKAKTQGEKLYDYNENVAIGESPVAFKSNDKEYVITKVKDGFYLYYDGNISRKLTQAELNDAVIEIKNRTVKPNTETEQNQTKTESTEKPTATEETTQKTEEKGQEQSTKETPEDKTKEETPKTESKEGKEEPKPQKPRKKPTPKKSKEQLEKEKKNALAKDFVDKLRGQGGWYAKDVFNYIAEHPELNFIERIYEKDDTVKQDLADFLDAIDDLNTLEGLKHYMSGAYGDKGRTWDRKTFKASYPYRGAVRTFQNAISRQEQAIGTGTNLGVKNGVVTFAEVEVLFEKLNSNTELAKLAKRVFATAKKIGVNIRFVNKTFSNDQVAGDNVGDMVEYKTSYFNDTTVTNQHKASTLVHEMIHICTMYVMSDNSVVSDPKLRAVRQRINDIYNDIKDDAEFMGEYGVYSANEMMAELANEKFVFKMKKKNLWQRIVDAICELFGISRGTSAYDNAKACLDYLLDNPDVKEYREYAKEQRRRLRAQGETPFGELSNLSDTQVRDGIAKAHEISKNLAYKDQHKQDLEKFYNENEASVGLDKLMSRYNKILDIWEKLGGELNSDFLNEWNSKVGKDRSFTVFKAQAGYKYNIELSTMCKKGVPLFEAIDTIVKKEVMKELGVKELGKAEKEILYDILKAHNFDIPCAICYVEQARQREGTIIKEFLDGRIDTNSKGNITKKKLGWNEVLKMTEEEMRKQGVEYTFPSLDRSVGTDSYMPKALAMDEKTQTAFYNAVVKLANEEIAKANITGKTKRPLLQEITPLTIKKSLGGKNLNLKIFEVLLSNPDSRLSIDDDILYSSMTTLNLAKSHKALYSLFNQQGGVAGYKSKQTPIIYWGDILGKTYKPKDTRLAGGIRNQSNSDSQAYTLLDKVQMYVDLTAKGYYLQAYTKVLFDLKLFGLSNGKQNASLIPRVVEYRKENGEVDVEKTMDTAGLDENGNPIYDDIEGIPHEEAFMLIEDAEYSKTITGVCIGYSDKHIFKVLDDSRIQLIIGYHDKSNDTTMRYRGAKYSKNYNNENEATYVKADGSVGTVHIGFNQFVQKAERMFKYNAETGESATKMLYHNGKMYKVDDIPHLATALYLEYCKEKGYKPAYNTFKEHPNYYKLLADFGLKDSQGHYAPHKKVAYNMPDKVPYLDSNGKKQYMATEEYIKAELKKEMAVRDSISEALADNSEKGIIPQFKEAVKKHRAEISKAKTVDNKAEISNAIIGSDKVMTALPSDKISVKDVITGNATVKDLANQAKSGLAEKTEAMRVLSTNAQASLERVMKEQGIADAEAQVNYVRAGRYASFNAIEKEGGQYNLMGNKRVGMSLGKILEPIYNADKKDGKTYADFELYLLHWHNIERYEAGKPVFHEWKAPTEEHVTSEDSRKAIEELDKIYPDFYKIAERVWRFNDNNLQLCVDSGMWSQEYADELREMYPHYVPTMREEYNTKVSALMGKNNVSINNANRKAVGSSEKILPIDDMISAQTIQKTTASRLNNLLVQMLEKGNHAEFEVIGTEDADLLEAYEGVSDMVTFHKDKGKKEHQVTFFYNGKKVTAKVSNLVYEGLNDFQGSAGIQDNLILASVAKANKGFKKLVTSVNPFFSFIRNPVRDMQDALLYTKYTPWQFLNNYKRAQKEIRTNGKYWQEAKSAGIASSSVYDYETGIEYRQKGLKANWKRLLNKIESVSQTIEMSPRLSEYISAREAGLSVEDALLQAQDVTTNFGRGGVFAKKLNSTISPFLNPSIQGFSKMFRAYTGKDGAKQWIALIIKSLILGVGVSALNDLINDDDEEYNDLSDYVKEQNYVIALGNGDFIKIPKGRVFSVFGSAFLRGKRYASGETNAFDDYLKSVASAVTPIDSVARTIISPFQDIATNTTWYGGAIEGQKWNDTAPKNRYDASTSKISIWLGEVFDYSPIKIDYLLDQYSGIVGDLVLPMTSTEAEGGIVTKNLIANSITNSRWSTQFYDTLDEYTYKKTEGDLQAKAVVRYMNNVSKTISDMYKQKSEIQADTKKSDKDKLKETKILQATINTLMKETLGNVKEMYDAFGKVDLSTDEAFDKAYYDSIKYFISAEQAFKVIGKDTYEKATKMTKLGVDYDSYYDYYYGLKGIESDRKADGTVINGSKKAKIIKYTKEQDLPIVQQLILIMSQGYTIADGDIKGVTAKTAKTKVAKYIASLNATAKEKTELAEMLGFTVKNGKIQLK